MNANRCEYGQIDIVVRLLMRSLMRFDVIILTIVALLALPWTGCSDGVEMVSIFSTNNATGAVRQKDVYTRDGRTNLSRNQLVLNDGTIKVLAHRLYCEGRLVAMISDVQGNVSISTEPDSPCGVNIEFHPDRTVHAVVLTSANGEIADMFLATNKVITPVSTVDLRKAQGVGKATSDLMRGATKKTAPEFYHEVEELIEKTQE